MPAITQPAKRSRSIESAVSAGDSIDFSRKAIFWWLPILYLLVCDAFYLRTYDSAQVKITLVQMGGLCTLALWMCRLVEEGWTAFSQDDLVCLAPFLAYFAWGCLSFLHAPYHWSSTDFFLRRVFYMTVPLIVVQEYNEEAVGRMTKLLIWSAWIAIGYGFLQWFDINFFPKGPGMGPDPFIWRGAFGDRIFSTYGNPNFLADFLVIMFPVIVSQWLKTRKFSLLVLLALDVFDLYGTQTKGAWIGFAIAAALLLGTYFYFFEREKLRAYRVQVGATMAVVVSAALLAVGLKLRSSFTSISFRLFTWEATWEMIMTQPVLGTGIGSFWVIYPAFRRPPIFHIEGKHNTETDHSEDEYLEVLFDEGIAGFGIFLWLILSTWVVAYRCLAQLTGSLKRGERAPPRAYELMGWLVAFQGMLIHNCFDVSMRFVSSGVYLGLLSGLVVNRSRGFSLSELHAKRELTLSSLPGAEVSPWSRLSDFFLWPARLAAFGGLGYMMYLLFTQYDDLQGPIARLTLGGEILQWWIAWTVFAACVVGLGYAFARVVGLTRNALVPLVVVAMLWPLNLAWGFFRADVYHNIAIFFSKQQQWEQALKFYQKVGELNPAYIMSYYFKGNVFNDRFNMTKIYNPAWGDKNNVARDDFERALAAYDEVRGRAPNYVQMHHQVGALFMKRGEWNMNQGRVVEGQRDWDEALHRLQMYRNIDPVFPPNYYRMGQIYMVRKDYDKAIGIYKALIDAQECRVDPRLSAKDWMRKTILSYVGYSLIDGLWVHQHATADAYTNLGNAYFMKGDLPQSEKAYKRALELDPKAANAARNLQVLYQKAQSLGRLRQAPMLPAAPGLPPQPPPFELIPYKK